MLLSAKNVLQNKGEVKTLIENKQELREFIASNSVPRNDKIKYSHKRKIPGRKWNLQKVRSDSPQNDKYVCK